MIKTHILGLPIIGKDRELKFSIEKYLNNDSLINRVNLLRSIDRLIINNINIQVDNKLDVITVGNYYINDPITYTMVNLGIVPDRFKQNKIIDIDLIIKLVKGTVNLKPLKMIKWFNTNYHYFVPKIKRVDVFKYYLSPFLVNELNKIKDIKSEIKVSIIGPLTFIRLIVIKSRDRTYIVNNIIHRYLRLINYVKVNYNVNWIQLEEPIVNDDKRFNDVFNKIYRSIAKIGIKIMVVNYFTKVINNLELLVNNKWIDGVHIDLINNDLINCLDLVNRSNLVISLGLINSLDIWITDISLLIKRIKGLVNLNCIWISCSGSLIHLPITNVSEVFIKKHWTSFALEKIKELLTIKDYLVYRDIGLLTYNGRVIKEFLISKLNINKYYYSIVNDKGLISKDKIITSNSIGLGLLPSTTIGSFPQTIKIRKLRKLFSSKDITIDFLNLNIKEEIVKVVNDQIKYNVNVIVNGELERGDMVEYFCQYLRGCSITKNGWVQSYSTRCVKPAILWGLIKDINNITSDWCWHLRKLTSNNIKLILTGPTTMVKWSFIRKDLNIRKIATMLSIVIKKEIKRSIYSGVNIIQLDEPALKEAEPVDMIERKLYYSWVRDCFIRSCKYAILFNKQIHTHICYSILTNKDIKFISMLGVDVITIEASKEFKQNIEIIRRNNLLELMEIGLGIYDVHTKYIPSIKTLYRRIKNLILNIFIERVWVNPDCGLKTRNTNEVINYLINVNEAIMLIKQFLLIN